MADPAAHPPASETTPLGQRTTRQRQAVIAALTSSDQFKTAQQWRTIVQRSGQPIGLTTVYRTLQSLAEADEVDVVLGDDGESKFRRCSAGHHHHLICRRCGKTVEVSTPELEHWAGTVAAEHGFTAEQHTVEISGLCSECAGGPEVP